MSAYKPPFPPHFFASLQFGFGALCPCPSSCAFQQQFQPPQSCLVPGPSCCNLHCLFSSPWAGTCWSLDELPDPGISSVFCSNAHRFTLVYPRLHRLFQSWAWALSWVVLLLRCRSDTRWIWNLPLFFHTHFLTAGSAVTLLTEQVQGTTPPITWEYKLPQCAKRRKKEDSVSSLR